MTPRIDVRSNIREVVAEFRREANEVVDRATVTALNRAMVTGRAVAARDLKKEYGALPIRVIKAQIRITRATARKPRAIMTFAARRIRLIRYGVFSTPRGIRGNGLPRKLLDQNGTPISRADLAHAFIRKARNTGTWNVMKREGKERYPLQIVLAPALAETIVDDTINRGMATVAVEAFEKSLRQELQYRLSKGA